MDGATGVAEELETQLTAVRRMIRTSPKIEPGMDARVRELEIRLLDVLEKFDGDPTKSRRNESAPIGLNSRLRTVMMGAMGSSEGPTSTHRRQHEIAREEFAAAVGDLRTLAEVDVPALFEELDSVGAPWTPGRKIPDLD